MRPAVAVLLGGLCCLRGQSLEALWTLPLKAAPAGPPVVFAGGAVIALATGRIAVVDPAGREVASAQMDLAAVGPALVDRDRIYAADVSGSIYRFDLTGKRVWKYARQSRAGSGYNTLVLADLDGDGEPGTILTDTRGHLYAVDQNGRLRIEIFATNYRLSTPAIGDVDGDGVADIVFGGDDETVYCVSGAGRLLWSRKLEGGRFGRSLPAIRDLDGDGHPEVYITTPFVGRQTGLHSLDAATGRPRWHFKSEMQTYASLMFLGDRILFGDKNTRLYALNGRGEKQWDSQLGGRGIFFAGAIAGDWHYQIVRDAGLDGKSLYVLDANGQVRNGIAMDGGGSYGPALTRNGTEPRLLAVSKSGTLHAYRIADGPFHWASWRNEPAPVRSKKLQTNPTPTGTRRAVRGTNPLPGVTAVDRPDGVRQVLIGSASFGVDIPGDYRVTAAGKTYTYNVAAEPFPLDPSISAPLLRAEWEFAMRHPTVERFDTAKAHIAEAQAIFRENPAGGLIIRQLDNPWSNQRTAAAAPVKMLGNEYESVAFTITNLRPEPAQVRITSDAPYIDIREVIQVRPESTGRLTEDALPSFTTLPLAPGETRKLWAIIHSRDLKPGAHVAKLRIGDMLSLDPPTEFPLSIEVSKARLPDQRVYHQCHWLYLASIADPKTREATIVDALEHGMNVFPIPFDSPLHDELIARLKGKGKFLITGALHARNIRAYADHMQALGLPFTDWAIYFMDEPGLMGKDAAFDKYVHDITSLKQADSRVRIYANPAGGAKPEMLAPLTGIVDVWQPDLHLVRERPDAYKKVFQTGEYWHYEAPADQRNLDPLGYYRMKPWVAFQMGMTGGGYWVYSYSNYWTFDRTMATEYGTVYTTPQGPVTTKRWEASRDGAEDFEMLWQLRELARAKHDAAAWKLVDEAVAFVTDGQENVSDISRQVSPVAPNYRRWMQYREQLIAAWERML